ncbi:molybdenum cofactor guanylyltransferase [Corynebacterium sp. TA-R-1]|uniref:Molybdenum cofactor guanylyltransferase n=1 Tax=Corynebacterium stercoris TaxID=2943490 RepID=A0ABT1FZW7_9CORY|nr:molybdenum cofactor guanylyltransferase [Corynebacterium stercoris]MCP1387325.1 molybdenum cofactor guanylyltransferase [Corynebacterium stercoris]
MADIGAIVLAGGRSSRMGADKAQVRVDGTRLIDVLLSTLPPAWPRVVVSPVDLGLRGTPTVSEDPPFGGPVAGIAAGLSHLERACAGAVPDLIAILAVDAPHAANLVPALAEALERAAGTADAALVESADGRLQPLCALWRRDALSRALTQVPARDASVMRLVRAAGGHVTVPGTGAERDYDTPAELAELGQVDL